MSVALIDKTLPPTTPEIMEKVRWWKRESGHMSTRSGSRWSMHCMPECMPVHADWQQIR